jgi:hypothetical protein
VLLSFNSCNHDSLMTDPYVTLHLNACDVIERLFFFFKKKVNWFPLRNEFSNKATTRYKGKSYKILID